MQVLPEQLNLLTVLLSQPLLTAKLTPEFILTRTRVRRQRGEDVRANGTRARWRHYELDSEITFKASFRSLGLWWKACWMSVTCCSASVTDLIFYDLMQWATLDHRPPPHKGRTVYSVLHEHAEAAQTPHLKAIIVM